MTPVRARLFAALCLAAALWSCADDERPYRHGRIDPETTPTMTTLRANTTISDSGYLRYRILAPTWLMFDNAAEPKWKFPDGMHIIRYDNKGKINATIDCDSAVYFSGRQTWRFDGAVDLASTDGQRFLTEQLWWNRLDHTVYSDSFIHIERPERVIEGFGFKSNDRMTDYVVLKPSGIFPASQFNPGDHSDNPSNPNHAQRPAGPTTTSSAALLEAYDAEAAAAEDPEDARRTDKGFNGTPTDTMFVSTSATERPRRRAARDILRRRTPRLSADSSAAAAPAPEAAPTTPTPDPARRRPVRIPPRK